MSHVTHVSGYEIRFDEPGHRSRAEVIKRLRELVAQADRRLERLSRKQDEKSRRAVLFATRDRQAWADLLAQVEALAPAGGGE